MPASIQSVAWVKADDPVDRSIIDRYVSGELDAILVEFRDGKIAVIQFQAGLRDDAQKWRDFFEQPRAVRSRRGVRPIALNRRRVAFESVAAASPLPSPLPKNNVRTSLQGSFEGHDPSQPLEVDHDYVFAFWATDIPTKNAITFDATDLPFEEGQSTVKLTIQLLGDDFEVQQPSQELFIGRDGKSRGKARFDVRTRRKGACTLEALILRDGNFVQKLTIATNVGTAGAPPVGEVSTVGRAFTTDERVQPRQLVIFMQEEASGYLRFIATKDGPISGRLKITDKLLDDLVSNVRKQLQEIVELFDDASGAFVYQSQLEIPKAIHEQALVKLANAGTFLFKTLFSGPGADEGMKAIGRLLREVIAAPEPLDVQIVTERFYFPWSLLYIADAPAAPIDARRFLGFAHRVEEVALRSHDARPPEIRHDANLQLGVYVNKSIDGEMKATFVADQIAFFDSVEKTHKARIATRDTADAALKALSDPNVPDQLMYFYCHARSGSVNDAALLLEKEKSITLQDLRLNAPDDPFRSTPLVVINACQSGQLSPLFYDGFIPELMSRGARGVIGTECDTPAIFAAAWATRFLREFLNGKELGKVVFDLRREFLEQENNLMGLLYAVHCNGNTRIDPALGLTAT